VSTEAREKIEANCPRVKTFQQYDALWAGWRTCDGPVILPSRRRPSSTQDAHVQLNLNFSSD
jgi:hypothetical protein